MRDGSDWEISQKKGRQMNKIHRFMTELNKECGVIASHNKETEWRNKAALTLIASAAFLIMSVLNVAQRSYDMLYTTVGSAIILIVDYLISRKKQNVRLIQITMITVVTFMFTGYVITGGNEGFAALWLIIIPFLAMLVADMRYGFLMSLYFMVFLILTFYGPFRFVIKYDYGEMFRLRFPFLYFIAFIFATYSGVRTTRFQYGLEQREEELERLGTVDILTGLMNRNSYNMLESSFSWEGLEELAVIFADVNGLHEYNNVNGHSAGDEMLKKIAEIFMSEFPKNGIFRMGGDEFLIVCQNIDQSTVVQKMDKVIRKIDDNGYSVSYGMETCSARDKNGTYENITEAVNKADLKMLLAKEEYHKYHNRKGNIKR